MGGLGSDTEVRFLGWSHMDNYQIIEVATGRVVITTEQAATRRGITIPAMRKNIARRIARGQITALPPLDRRTPVYYPEDLGLEQP